VGFDGGTQFFLQGFDKLRYPATPVIVVAKRDEDVVFKAWDDGIVKYTKHYGF
jgi:hypothetical protein